MVMLGLCLSMLRTGVSYFLGALTLEPSSRQQLVLIRPKVWPHFLVKLQPVLRCNILMEGNLAVSISSELLAELPLVIMILMLVGVVVMISGRKWCRRLVLP